MYESADNTPVIIASETQSIIITSLKESRHSQYIVYPNPSDGNIYVDGIDKDTYYLIHTLDGRLVRKDVLTNGVNKLSTQLSPGEYLFVKQDKQRPFSTKLLVRGWTTN